MSTKDGSVEAPEGLLSADDIFAADDLEYQDVVIPEWKKNGKPGVLRLRVLTAEEMIAFTELANDPARKQQGFIRIISLSAINKDGERVFTDAQTAQLKKKSQKVFVRLQDVCLELNGLKPKAKEAAKNDSSEALPDASLIG